MVQRRENSTFRCPGACSLLLTASSAAHTFFFTTGASDSEYLTRYTFFFSLLTRLLMFQGSRPRRTSVRKDGLMCTAASVVGSFLPLGYRM